MSSSSTLALAELRDGPLYRFADWPNPEVPNGRIGVYTVWGGGELIYVGMGGVTDRSEQSRTPVREATDQKVGFRRARCMPDRTVNGGRSRSVPDSPIRRSTCSHAD
jgi:hypothetical protein